MGVNPKLLRRSPLFAELSTADLDAVAGMGGMRWFDRGHRLYQQGDRIEFLYLVLDGAVKLSRVTEGGKSMVVDFLGPGHVAAGRAIAGQKRHADDAGALEDVLVATIPVEPAVALLGSRPVALMALARFLAARLESREAKVAALSTTRVHQRLGDALLELSRTLGVVADGVTVINARLTQAELAEWIGTTRETTSTLLNGLRRAGFIDIVSRRIHIVDPLVLEVYASVEELPEDLADLVAATPREPALARSA